MNCFTRLLILTATIFLTAQKHLAANAPGAKFQRDAQELIDCLAAAGLLPQLDTEQEAEFLLKFLQNLSIPTVITNLAKAEADEATKTNELRSLSTDEGIFYLRLGNFHLPEPQQTAVWLDDFKQQAGRALVIDLRQINGFSLAAEEAHLGFLRELPVPMLILIDSATAGTPESMIRKLQEEREVLTLGSASRGIGGTGQEIKLYSGLTLRVPVLENGQLPPPFQPDVELSQDIATFKDIETIANPAMDPWCQHARDTLKVILTLSAKETP
jgi:hypothetical protein